MAPVLWERRVQRRPQPIGPLVFRLVSRSGRGDRRPISDHQPQNIWLGRFRNLIRGGHSTMSILNLPHRASSNVHPRDNIAKSVQLQSTSLLVKTLSQQSWTLWFDRSQRWPNSTSRTVPWIYNIILMLGSPPYTAPVFLIEIGHNSCIYHCQNISCLTSNSDYFYMPLSHGQSTIPDKRFPQLNPTMRWLTNPAPRVCPILSTSSPSTNQRYNRHLDL
jgi:hypothetical protein